MSSLNISIIRKDLKKFDEIVEEREPPLERISLDIPDGTDGHLVKAALFYERRPMNLPKWSEYFRGLFDISSLPRVSSCPAALLVSVDDLIFSVVFSHGGSLLNAGVHEPAFGLRVALNSISLRKMTGYDKKSFDALFRQTREHAARDTKLTAFGIDAERDLVRKVTGKPKDTTLGTSMTGGTSLAVSTKVKPKGLVHYLRRLHRIWKKDLPEEYAWLGCIEEMQDDARRGVLDLHLDERISQDCKDVWLAPPNIVDWATEDGFRFVLPNRNRMIYPSIDFQHLSEALDGSQSLSVALLRNQKVEMLDHDHNPIKKWQLYSCVNAEVHLDNETYVLSNGTWYKIDTDLLTEIDRVIESLPQAGLHLPEYNEHDKDEKAYNERVARENPEIYCCLDGKDIPFGGGHSKFELCDLITSTGDLIHVKRGRNSDRLSHLFAQGLISAELVMTRESVRKAADKLVESHQFELPRGKFFSGKHARDVVYVIIGESHKLPVFSRVNLRNAVRRLSGFSWGVRLMFVPESDVVRLRKQQKKRAKK